VAGLLQRALPQPGLPATGRVQLWCLALPRLAALAPQCAALLNDSQRRRADRFRFDRDRLRHVLTHGVVRQVLGQALGLPSAGLRFVTGPQGKPALAAGAPADLRFNLAHAGDWLYLALALGREVGVDVERQRPEIVDDLLPSLDFTAAERAWIGACTGPARALAFFRAWSRKEAAIKAWGAGLSLPLGSFDVTPGPAGFAPLRAPAGLAAAASAWTIGDLPAPDGYSAALVTEGPPPAVQLLGHLAGDGATAALRTPGAA
jgi:4'-phosphopantetheinyl transferase